MMEIKRSTAEADRRSYLLALGSGQLSIAIVAGTQLLAVPIQISALGMHGFGIVALVTTWLAIAAAPTVWLTSGGVRRLGEAVATERWDVYAATRRAVRMGLTVYGAAISAAVYALGFVLAPTLEPALNEQLIAALPWLCLYLFFYYEQAWLTVVLTARKNQHICNYAVSVQSAIFLGALWVFTQWEGTLSAVYAAFAVGVVTSRLILFVGLRRALPEPESPGRTMTGMRGLFSRRGAGYTAYGGLTLIQNADTALVGALGGAEAAALYSLVWRVPTLLIQVFWRVPSLLEPYIIQADAAGDRVRVRTLFGRGEWAFYGAVALAALAYAVLGPWILELWVGSTHAAYPLWVYWLAGGATLWLAAVRWPINFLHALARLKGLTTVLAIEVAARALAIWLLYPILGFAAPLAATNIVMAGGAFWIYRTMSRSAL